MPGAAPRVAWSAAAMGLCIAGVACERREVGAPAAVSADVRCVGERPGFADEAVYPEAIVEFDRPQAERRRDLRQEGPDLGRRQLVDLDLDRRATRELA